MYAGSSERPFFRADARMDSPHGSHHAIGIGYSKREARLAAIGEAFEGYAASHVPNDRLIESTASELGDSAIQPESFPLFSSEQYARPGFAFTRFTSQTRLRWVRARSLTDGRSVYVPTQFVYLPRHEALDDTPLGYATSSGMAAGPTLEDATLAGLLEVVERDAVMIAWYNRLSLPLLDTKSMIHHIPEIARVLRLDEARYVVVNLSAFTGIPVALCVRYSDEFPGVTVGSASAVTMARAARKAVGESFQTALFLRNLGKFARREHELEFTTFAEHAFYHAHPPRPHLTDFLVASQERVNVEDVAPIPGRSRSELIASVLDRLCGLGFEAFVVDTTPRDKARAPALRSVTVLCPRLCRADVGWEFRYLGNPRLYSAARDVGLARDVLAREEVNPEPHPLA